MAIRENAKHAKNAKARTGAPCVASSASLRTGVAKVRLGEVVTEFSYKNRDGECAEVYSVTNSGGFVPSTEYFSKEVFSKDLTTYKIVEPGMFAYNPSRINVGSVNYWSGDRRVIVSPLYVVVKVDDSRTLNRYLNYFLHSESALFQIRHLTEGTVRDTLKFSAFQQLQIPLPPLVQQRRIAAELDQLCALKKNAEDRLAILGQIAKSQFVEIFGEQESAKYPLLEIGSLFKVGGPKRIHQREWTEEGVPFLRVSDVVSKIKGDISLPAMYISNDRYAELKEAGAVPSAGDILVTARGTLGECYIVKADDAFYFQDGMITWLSAMDGRLDVTYIVNAMRQDGFRRQFLGKEVGSTVAYLSISQLAKLKVIVPPLPLQRQFAAFIEQLDKSLFTLRETIATLDQLYRAKLQEYFG